MRAPLLTLAHPQTLRVPAPARVFAERGVLWITVDGETEDILLEAGECRSFESTRPIVVYALGGDAQFAVSPLAARPAGHRRGTWLERGLAWLRGRRAALRWAP